MLNAKKQRSAICWVLLDATEFHKWKLVLELHTLPVGGTTHNSIKVALGEASRE